MSYRKLLQDHIEKQADGKVLQFGARQQERYKEKLNELRELEKTVKQALEGINTVSDELLEMSAAAVKAAPDLEYKQSQQAQAVGAYREALALYLGAQKKLHTTFASFSLRMRYDPDVKPRKF